MANKEKNMQYANFNVTFGDDNEPMLSHFDDIIMPALKAKDIYRYTKDKSYCFNDVFVKEFDGKYALCGNVVKNMKLERETTLTSNMEVREDHAEMESFPISRFIVFLENHRMVLTLNERFSPDIRSFKATLKDVLDTYVKKHNSDKQQTEFLPYATVNVVDLPLTDDIDMVMRDITKIKYVKWQFFPLNGDRDFTLLNAAATQTRQGVGSFNAVFICTSPTSKEGVVDAIKTTAAAGQAHITIEAKDRDGVKRTIKEDTFRSSGKIEILGNLSEYDDVKIVESTKSVPELSLPSPGTADLCGRMLGVIKKWMHK